jgi:hypothetical protein
MADTRRPHEDEGTAHRTAVEAIHRYSAGTRKALRLSSVLFPNQQKPEAFMSENTMLYALYRMGYHSRTTGHGFSSTASTILNEHGFRAYGTLQITIWRTGGFRKV